jgi:hypothetical protein
MIESLTRINRSVQRAGAVRYLLLMLISFAFSVTATRIFLNLTGFPKIGTGTFHLAHVLWGGLILYAAAVIPLQFANRWVYSFSAILSGIGMGLFIDEVGKFITSTNDYFYPPAAPIIYSFFLISTILYIQARKNKPKDDRSALYHAFDLMEEVLEHELDSDERKELVATLSGIRANSKDADYRHLADELLHFVEAESVTTITKKHYFSDHVIAFLHRIRERYFTERNLYVFISVSVLCLGLYLLQYPLRFFLSFRSIENLGLLVQPYIASNLITPTSGLDWLTARVILEGLISIILLVGGVCLVIRQRKLGISLSYLGIILVITTLNLLIFYYDQFSTIGFATIQVSILLLILYYRNHYLNSTP